MRTGSTGRCVIRHSGRWSRGPRSASPPCGPPSSNTRSASLRHGSAFVSRAVSSVEWSTEALDQPGSLPLLQFALAELFDRRSGATITTEVYDQIGGLSGSVAHQAESLYANFTPPDQLAVRRLFARLVTAGDGAEDTRRTARRSELVGVDDQVVNALVDRRLLTVDRDRESREPTIEIAHEALLRGWPRLREWLDEDRDWVRELRALASATRLWESSGRDDADLYRGARLAVTNELVHNRTDSLTSDEAAFLDASSRLVDAERLATEERAQTRERQNRRLRRSLVGLGVVTILALIAGLVAVGQSNRADDQATQAQAQAALAAEQSADADAQRAVADQERATAETAADQANAAEADTAFVNLANTSILERSNRQDLAALLAIEAYRIDPTRALARRCSRRSPATSGSSATGTLAEQRQRQLRWSESCHSPTARMRSVRSMAASSFASTLPRAPRCRHSIPSTSVTTSWMTRPSSVSAGMDGLPSWPCKAMTP